MKKIYFSILTLLAFTMMISAQTTIINDDYTDASYDVAAVQTDLNDHADWFAGHFGNANTWNANTNDQIQTQSEFAFAVNQTAITAVDGDVLTIIAVVLLGNNPQLFDATNANKLLFLAGLSYDPAPAVNTILGQERDGVLVRSDGPGARVFMSDAGPSGFGIQPEITTAAKAAYEIIIEYTLGADAASSSKVARIRNLGSNETSPIETANGIRSQIYTALTGAGAYYFNWALDFSEAGAINVIYNNRIEVVLNGPLLSTEEHNAFEFEMYPNPVKDKLYINSQETINKIEAVDLLGRTVLTVDEVSDVVDVSSLTNAIYVIRLTSDKGISTRKFIKE